MAESEGLFIRFSPVTEIKPEILETFPYYMKEVKACTESDVMKCQIEEDDAGPASNEVAQKIVLSTDEFSAVCPFSGLPDIGKLNIEYIPGKKCVELKSFKYYLFSYRNVGIYQEHAARKIFQDMMNVLEPGYLKLKLTYNIRGGIETTSIMESTTKINEG